MKKSGGKGLLALIFGALIGAITALFLGTDKKGDTKKGVKESVGKTKKKVESMDKKKIMDKVGKKLDKSSQEFKKAQATLNKKLAAAKKKLDTVDKTKYQKLVSEVVADLKKSGKVTATQIKEIKSLLTDDYKKVAPKKKAKKTAKKK